MWNERIFRGEIYCTRCHQEGAPMKRRCDLFRMEDGSYQGLCYDHRPKKASDPKTLDYEWIREHLAALEMCFHIPWRDVKQIILHKPDPNSYDRRGVVTTVVMREVPNVGLMREHAIEVLHGLQLMADDNATIHQWNKGTEQNDCWTDANYSWESPATGRIIDKYWGETRIENFHKLCRTMAKIHKWELIDETMNALDRIVQALDEAEEDKR